MPRLLVISPHFPPVNAPDMQRVRMSLPHFVTAGWEVVVLTVDDDRPQAPLEPSLLATVPAAVRVVRAPVFSRRWTRLLGVNNLGWRALPFLHAAARRLLRTERFDVVYFSTTQFAVLPLGRLWQREFGVPYVIDLQDPWLNDYYERSGTKPPGGWKYRVARAVARTLEGWTLQRCAHVISVSPSYLETLAQRYAWFSSARGTVLSFGAPEEDFELVRRLHRERPPLLPQRDTLKVACAGRLGADMIPALAVLFAAVARLRGTRGRPVELFFFGTSYAEAGAGRSTTAVLAAKYGVTGQVHEHPARIGYLDALRLLVETDVALLLGSDHAAYSPSKLHPTLLADRPTLALMPRGSVLDQLTREFGGVTAVNFEPATEPESDAVLRVAEMLGALSRGESWSPDKPADRARLRDTSSARVVAERQLAVFERIIAAGGVAGEEGAAAT